MITKTQENLAIHAIFASCKVIKKSEAGSHWEFGNNFLNSHYSTQDRIQEIYQNPPYQV